MIDKQIKKNERKKFDKDKRTYFGNSFHSRNDWYPLDVGGFGYSKGCPKRNYHLIMKIYNRLPKMTENDYTITQIFDRCEDIREMIEVERVEFSPYPYHTKEETEAIARGEITKEQVTAKYKKEWEEAQEKQDER